MRWESRANKKQFDLYQKRTVRFPYKFDIAKIVHNEAVVTATQKPKPLIQSSRQNVKTMFNIAIFYDYLEAMNRIPEKVEEWLEENDIKYVTSDGCIKFKKKEDATLFKLVWG